jgi:Type II secretion system (T2SS), protein M subtype b
MIYSLSKPLRQIFAVSLLALVLAGLGLLIVAPVLAHITDLKERIDQERMMAGRLLDLVSDESGRLGMEQQTKLARTAGYFMEGESEPIRLAMLQSSLSAIATSQGIKLRSARNLPARERNELRLLGVQLQLIAPIDRLQKILLDIEQHKPSLIVDQIQITPLTFSRAQDDDQTGLLDVRLDVFAIESKQKG